MHRTNPRDFGLGRHRSVDDTPYGGGPGMILRVEPIAAALDAIAAARGPSRRVLLSPQGARFDQRKVRELAAAAAPDPDLRPLRGLRRARRRRHVDEQLSIGDFVLAGGELAAAVVIEAVARLVPGVLGCGMSAERRVVLARAASSTRSGPGRPSGRARPCPTVLLSGTTAPSSAGAGAKRCGARVERRPDLLAAHPLTEDERACWPSAARTPEPPKTAESPTGDRLDSGPPSD